MSHFHRNLARKSLLESDVFAGYVFIAPWLIGFLFLSLIPMGTSIYYAFTNYNLISEPKLIGFENFRRMISDTRLHSSIKATLYYVFLSVPLKVGFALVIAIILNRKMKLGFNFFRSAYYLPTLVGGGIPVALMWKQLFANEGVVNGILAKFGIEGISWLGEKSTAIWVIILLTVWQFGSSMLIFSAGLKQIPEVYYEAARIDGARPWQTFIHITIPSLSSIIFFNLIMQTISAFTAFTQAYTITNGKPLDSTLLYALYVYRKALDNFDMGYACALSLMLILVIGLITAIMFRLSGKWVYYESKEG